jgi:hypothetical protein
MAALAKGWVIFYFGMISLNASEHLRHENDGHTLNVNEFCYRHREGVYKLTTTMGTVIVRPGDGKTPDGRRAMMDRPECRLAKVLAAEAEQDFPCLCRQMEERLAARREKKAGELVQITNPEPVSASQLATWRRSLVQLLSTLDQGSQKPPNEGVAGRISRLQRDGILPREVGAMMRTVTEMRNAAEYESKSLTAAESAVVRASWKAIQEWALRRGVELPD